MSTVVRQGMVEAAFVTNDAFAAFRSLFIGKYFDLPYEPNPVSEPWFLMCYGQTLVMADYPILGARLGNRYGGNGVTTFALPDARGRVMAGLDNMGGSSANRLTNKPGGLNGDVLTNVGGSEEHVLTVAQLAAHVHHGYTEHGSPHQHATAFSNYTVGGGSGGSVPGAGSDFLINTTFEDEHFHEFTTEDAGGSQAHNNVQPTMICVRCVLAF